MKTLPGHNLSSLLSASFHKYSYVLCLFFAFFFIRKPRGQEINLSCIPGFIIISTFSQIRHRNYGLEHLVPWWLNGYEKIKGIELQLEVLRGSLEKKKKRGEGLKALRGILKERFSEEEIKAIEINYKGDV